ncbi:unnamed protein product, partial [Ectocarpus sp. 12 AP-2014]
MSDAMAALSDASEARGRPLSPQTSARLRFALKRVADGVPVIERALGLDRAPDVLLEPALVTYAFVKSATHRMWDILFACQGRCGGCLGGGSGG